MSAADRKLARPSGLAAPGPRPARAKAASPARTAVRGKKEVDVKAIQEKVRELEVQRKDEEKCKTKEAKRRQKEMAVAKKQINREVQQANQQVRRREMEASKVATAVGKVEGQTDKVRTAQRRELQKLEDNLVKLRTKRHGFEKTLQEKVSLAGEARGKLAHMQFAAKMLEAGVIMPTETSGSDHVAMPPGVTSAQGRRGQAESLPIHVLELREENERLRLCLQQAEQQLAEGSGAQLGQRQQSLSPKVAGITWPMPEAHGSVREDRASMAMFDAGRFAYPGSDLGEQSGETQGGERAQDDHREVVHHRSSVTDSSSTMEHVASSVKSTPRERALWRSAVLAGRPLQSQSLSIVATLATERLVGAMQARPLDIITELGNDNQTMGGHLESGPSSAQSHLAPPHQMPTSSIGSQDYPLLLDTARSAAPGSFASTPGSQCGQCGNTVDTDRSVASAAPGSFASTPQSLPGPGPVGTTSTADTAVAAQQCTAAASFPPRVSSPQLQAQQPQAQQADARPAEACDLGKLAERATASVQQAPLPSADWVAARAPFWSSTVAVPQSQLGGRAVAGHSTTVQAGGVLAEPLARASFRQPTEPMAVPQQRLGPTAVATPEPVVMKANGLARPLPRSPATMPTLLASQMMPPKYFESKAPQQQQQLQQQRQVSVAWM